MTKPEIERLQRRMNRLLEEKLPSRIIRPILFRGRRIETAQDVDDVVRLGGLEYAAKMKGEREAKP